MAMTGREESAKIPDLKNESEALELGLAIFLISVSFFKVFLPRMIVAMPIHLAPDCGVDFALSLRNPIKKPLLCNHMCRLCA